MTAKQRYDRLSSSRSQFLNAARQASELTLPYLIREDEHTTKGALKLTTPWQSTGAKGVVTLASKLMLALLPPQTSFFKLQVNDVNLPDELGPEIRSELDLSFAKIERTVMESIAESGDRVVVHQALKHLVVAGNALIFMSKDGLKLYPLSRYVVDRDGNGNVIEIVTKETISKKLIKKFYPEYEDKAQDSVVDDGHIPNDECVIYTHVKLDNNRWVWHQELEGKILPKSMGKAPFDANPWLVLRFNHVDGEVYGRGRVEEFLGDLKSLEALSQAIVEGSAAAAKVVFTVSPSSTTKPQTLAKAGNGAIIQGRPDDIGVVQVGKTADFSTAYQMIGSLTQRLNEAFLILNVRDSERTTAEEVRMTQLELEQQLGGLFSLLTVEFLVPYLNRKLNVAQKTGDIPRLPQGGIVRPTIVAGINALGRGQDRESLAQFLTVIAQTMGPDAIAQYINPDEVIKRLAASSGIDVLNLVKSMQELQAEQAQQLQQQQAMMAQQQAPQMAAVAQKADAAQMQAAQQAQEQQLPPQ
jgi:hypothetical protein|tara:strand:- start:405 stop:1985 length:1581 start_codon:yes stop_codon:yes gene_type:complete